MSIWFATGNIHKKEELAAILGRAVKIPAEAGLAFDPEETGSTFLENALIKAAELYRLLVGSGNKGILNQSSGQLWQSGDAIIADDSGLCVDALDGSPGIFSARYGGKDLDAAGKNALLLDELGNNPMRSARFICAMVLYYGPGRFYIAQECLEGELVKNNEFACGKGGFGYDPILYIPGMGRTVAELSPEEKNKLSHRGKAGRAIARILAIS